MLTKLHRWGGKQRSELFQVGFVGAAFALSLGLRFALDPYLPPGFPFLTFFPIIVITHFILNTRAAVVLATLSGVAAFYFFVDPRRTFEINSASGLAFFFYLVIVGTNLVLLHVLKLALATLAGEKQKSLELATARTLMFQEMQHRVSNNLQVISSLLKLQQRVVKDPAASAALELASARVNSVARIQRSLHDPQRQQVDFNLFLRGMVDEVLHASGVQDRVSCRIDADPVKITSDQSVPLALICTECLSNAIEHGLTEGGHMTIEITFKLSGEGRAILMVRDDGGGLPEGYDIMASPSLGLQIARQFAAQLDGTIEMTSDHGTVVRLDFPVERQAEATGEPVAQPIMPMGAGSSG
jgi:two-component sensor histidine kinase